jgi:heme-degrading monooxygenase HmoA/quinol monooxygenase YgiN
VFSVMFEVHPRPDQFDGYLSNAKMLRPELEQINGFVDNIRYGSLTRDGWILSLSGWRDEKALVRWRTQAQHHHVQELGRQGILLDYHLRVGQITEDTHLPDGLELREQRLDETEIGEGTTAVLITAHVDPGTSEPAAAEETAALLGLDRHAGGLVFWDVYDAVLEPGNLLLHTVWRDAAAAEGIRSLDTAQRRRQIRIVRDYTKDDRREAPQFYPPATASPADEGTR